MSKTMNYALEARTVKTPKAATPKSVTPTAQRVAVVPRASPMPAVTVSNPKQPTPPPPKTGGTSAKLSSAKYPGKKYTEQEIHEILSEGYISIHNSLWDYIPSGAHIRYVKRDDGTNYPRAERFKPGGFVRNHFTTEEGKKMIMIETKPGGHRGEPGYISFPIAYADVEELWKKYDRHAFLEIHLIYGSLAQKKQQIEDLSNRVQRLEAILRGIVKQ